MLRGTRLFLPLIVLAVAGAAMANGPTVLPHDEHYPAAYLHKASLEEARTAEALMMARLMRGHEGDEKMREHYTAIDPDDWLRLGSHSLLAKVFPGAAFYLTSPAGIEGCRAFAAVRNGKYYLLPRDVGQLLYDCGMRFDDNDMPNWLRAIAIVQSGGPVVPDSMFRGLREMWQDKLNAIWARVHRGELPYLPEFEIERVRLDTGAVDAGDEWIRGKVHQARIWVRRNGKKDSVDVEIGVWEIDGRLVRGPTTIGLTTRISEPQSNPDGTDDTKDSVRTRKSPQEW